jgi:hypothetical protein
MAAYHVERRSRREVLFARNQQSPEPFARGYVRVSLLSSKSYTGHHPNTNNELELSFRKTGIR